MQVRENTKHPFPLPSEKEPKCGFAESCTKARLAAAQRTDQVLAEAHLHSLVADNALTALPATKFGPCYIPQRQKGFTVPPPPPYPLQTPAKEAQKTYLAKVRDARLQLVASLLKSFWIKKKGNGEAGVPLWPPKENTYLVKKEREGRGGRGNLVLHPQDYPDSGRKKTPSRNLPTEQSVTSTCKPSFWWKDVRGKAG